MKVRCALVAVLGVLLLCVGSGCATDADSARSSQSPFATGNAKPSATPTPSDPVVDYVDATMKTMTLKQKVASLLMLHSPGTDGAALKAFVDRYGLGGIILMGDNIPQTPAELLAETQAVNAGSPLPVLIATDEEGGDVTRLGWDTLPGADQLKSLPPAATAQAFSQRADLLKQSGVNVNFGIIADTTADPNSFIYDRVLGTDAAASAQRVSAAVTAENGKVLSTIKHFPGHGETEADSHLTVPTTAISPEAWAARDKPSFEAGVKAGAPIVMFGHLVYSSVDSAPASLSATWHRILHDQLGFTGITITDDLRMLQDTGLAQYQDPAENAVQALAAGNTMLLMVTAGNPAVDGVDPAAVISRIVEAVQSGRISQSQIDADVRALLTTRRELAS